jgi:hypothetical protein
MSRKSSLVELSKEYEKILMEQNIGIESGPQNVLLKNALSPSGEQMSAMVNKADAEKEKCPKCEAGSCPEHKTISFVATKAEDEEGCDDCDSNMEAHENANLDMAKSEIFKIKKYVTQLCSIINDSCKIEAWMLAKLVQASDYLCSVTGVLEYDNYERSVEQPVQDFSNDMHVVSRITSMLNSEGREVNEAVLKRAIFNLEMINNK